MPRVTRFLSITNNQSATLSVSCCYFAFSKTIRKGSESMLSGAGGNRSNGETWKAVVLGTASEGPRGEREGGQVWEVSPLYHGGSHTRDSLLSHDLCPQENLGQISIGLG